VSTVGHPTVRCPHCGKCLDHSTSIYTDAMPNAGDLSVCVDCGGFLTYGDDLRLRGLSEREFAELPLETRAQLISVAKALALAKAMN
jgi:hypothetical protein